jgi:hypothetical protein
VHMYIATPQLPVRSHAADCGVNDSDLFLWNFSRVRSRATRRGLSDSESESTLLSILLSM